MNNNSVEFCFSSSRRVRGWALRKHNATLIGSAFLTAIALAAVAIPTSRDIAYAQTTCGTFVDPNIIANPARGNPGTAVGNTACGAGATSAASGGFGTAIGNNATASGLEGPTAVGAGSLASGDDATAVGGAGGAVVGAHATGDGSVAVGVLSNSSSFGSVSIGSGSTASQAGSIAIGGGSNAAFSTNAASATAFGAVALGTNARASAANSVAVGQNSVANVANTFSVGSAFNTRAVVNVAAGVAATDAVNVGQLQNGSFAANLASLATAGNAVIGGTLAVTGLTTTNGINNSGQKITNLGAGTLSAASTDAINGSQLFTANQRIASILGSGAGLDATGQLTAPTYTVQGASFNNVGNAIGALDTGVTNINNNGTKFFQSNSTGAGASATGANAIAVGSNASATATGAISIGLNSAATGTNAIAIGTGASATGSVAVGTGASAANGGAAFGDNATATGTSSTAVGPSSNATFANSTAVGNGATATRANQQVFGTATNTYTMPGVSSAASAAAQTGATRVVTSDAAGNLATNSLAGLGIASSADVAGINARLDDLTTRSSKAFGGVAMAMAMAGTPTVLPNERFVAAMNWGTFEGAQGFALAGAYRLSNNVQINGGVGFTPNQSVAGGRAGVRIGF